MNSLSEDLSEDLDYVTCYKNIRYFLAPAFESAITSLNLAAGARVLDAATRAGGALPLLARAVGTTGSVLGVDFDPVFAGLASDYVEETGISEHVTVHFGDLSEVLADAATAPEKAFDAIWSFDLLLSMYVEEPADVVRQMSKALRPGGVVAVFYGNYYNSIFLPGHSRLERVLCTALDMNLDLPADGPRHKGRHLAWLQDAGLDDVSLTMHPRVCFPVDADPTLRQYLEGGFWAYLQRVAANHGAAAGLSTAEVDEVLRLTTPGGPDYILDEPGYHYTLPSTLATGRRPM